MTDRGFAMGADMPVVKSAVVAARDLFGGLMAAVPDWQARLRKDPDQLQAIEQEVHALMAQCGDMVVCGFCARRKRQDGPRAQGHRRRRIMGPNAIAELVAMHLHRLGAAHAESVTFSADGVLDLGPSAGDREAGGSGECSRPSGARQLPRHAPHLPCAGCTGPQ